MVTLGLNNNKNRQKKLKTNRNKRKEAWHGLEWLSTCLTPGLVGRGEPVRLLELTGYQLKSRFSISLQGLEIDRAGHPASSATQHPQLPTPNVNSYHPLIHHTHTAYVHACAHAWICTDMYTKFKNYKE